MAICARLRVRPAGGEILTRPPLNWKQNCTLACLSFSAVDPTD